MVEFHVTVSLCCLSVSFVKPSFSGTLQVFGLRPRFMYVLWKLN